MEGISGGGETLEQSLIQQAARVLASRYNGDPADGYQYLSALARDRGTTLTRTARSVLGERDAARDGARGEGAGHVFDSSRYLRRTHPKAMERSDKEPPSFDDVPDPPEWVDSVLAAIHVYGCYCLPLRIDGRIADFVVVRANERAADIAAPGSSLIGCRLTDINPNVLSSGLFDEHVRAFESGEPFSRGPFEYIGVRNGRFEPSTATMKSVRAGPGLLITWELQPEEDQLLARWRQSERLAGLGWAEWNLFTDEIVWTRRMYDIFGRDPASGPLRMDEMPALLLPEDLAEMEEAVRTVFEHREATTGEYRIKQRTGIRHVTLMMEPVLDADADPVAVRILAQEITGRRRRERALAATQQRMLDEHRRAEEERRFATRLREVILPLQAFPMTLPGLVVGARYLATERIGGDWHKARPLPDGRVLLAIGDAMGHGLEAATLMAQMRAGLAGLAYTGAEADHLMTWLNELVRAEAGGEVITGTALLGHFEVETRHLSWVRAGHPPPILVRGGDAWLLEAEAGPLLGVLHDPEYPLTETSLEPDDLLLLYTDGIVDRRDEDLDGATERLMEAAAVATGSVEDRLDAVIRAMRADRTEDDVCLMAAWIR
ncbi:PP2C family protein-serine/threonine phosphatase [Thermomonospora umbrina]|uniref:PP2C family protein-serine/threonine phosphatase n=1 Tax=Thermomonospora umbrina TaxID=111806 RepID=UPI0014768476|nr:PP2C family protein-serine/threonine phosphatase [Thermomonospora umbrina]